MLANIKLSSMKNGNKLNLGYRSAEVTTGKLIILVVIGAIVGIGFVAASSSYLGQMIPRTVVVSSLPTTSTSTTLQNTSSTSTPFGGSGQSVTITLVFGASGWNSSSSLTVKIKQGTNVTLNIIDQDPAGDQHPLFVTGLNIVGPTMSPSDTKDSIKFVTSATGTYQILCLDSNCDIHNMMSGTLNLVVA